MESKLIQDLKSMNFSAVLDFKLGTQISESHSNKLKRSDLFITVFIQ